MQKMDEKQAFSERLRQALKRSPKNIESATELALQFSLHHPGDNTVTPQATHKWLTGKAIPRPDKLNTLAEWLDVSPMWLRHGIADEDRPERRGVPFDPNQSFSPSYEELRLLHQLRNMPEARRRLVFEIAEQLALDDAVWVRRLPSSIKE